MNSATSNVSFASQGWDDAATLPNDDESCAIGSANHELHGRLDRAESEAQFSSAVLELIDKVAQADNLEQAGITLVGELQDYFGCQRVAFGVCARTAAACRLTALSGLGQFDPRSEFARAVESALDECVVRGTATVWPAASDQNRHALLAHQKLSTLADAEKVIGVPLRNARREIIGAILFLGAAPLDRPAGFQVFLQVCENQLGKWIELVRRSEPGPIARQLLRLRRTAKGWQGKAAVGLAVFGAAILAMPAPYKIKCDCQIQPHTRRFIVAPFEGRLEKSLVKQGEVVTQGQVMARMDAREIRLELAGLAAERGRSSKQRDAAMATQKVADAQAAKLEMDRLDVKIQLLERRADNLEVRSPIDGIVIGGDLERAEGAPLTIGQTLFEVAPLDKMVVELAIPEDDVSYVKGDLRVIVRLDAYPGRTWTAAIDKIHPRAEIRQSQNVFVAELQLENEGESLRPGMNGAAKVVGPRHLLAWNLFHKPADWLLRHLGF